MRRRYNELPKYIELLQAIKDCKKNIEQLVLLLFLYFIKCVLNIDFHFDNVYRF
ncbi:hypothetical protein SAMN04487921_103134 [Bacillus altitudinis]|nr:hypothetical protein SAMN04487921_103134 [Bacillus altitudinis]SNS02315.1 hypothetical protein SAMN05880584_10490 [Bacillus altitudinis]